MAFLCFRVIIVVMMIVFVAASNRYMVGDKEGWKMPEEGAIDLYQTWASKIKFQVGESIVFEYRNDSVVRVEKRGFYHCNETRHGSLIFKDGNTVILLDRPGFYYFVSGEQEHCKKGQRLMIEVPAGPASPFPAAPSPSPALSRASTSASYRCPLRSLLLVLVFSVAIIYV